MATDAIQVDAMSSDAEPAQAYDMIERDTVPAPAPRPDDSLQKRIAELLKWPQPTDFLSPGNEFMKHLHSYVPGTGRWVHEAAPFRAWAGLDKATESHDHCLHVRGVAGSGKSVFAANTVRQLQEAGHVVLFFFFRQIVDKNHTARYLEHAVRGNELELVWPALVEALKGDEGGVRKRRVFCVVDALDEMDDGDFEGMVGKLVALGTTESATVRVMMTSRPLPHIEQALGHPGVVRLRLDPALLSPDVARYVDTRMATLDPPLSDDKNELVRQTLCERANGLFLQARLMADNLAEGLRDGRITEATLPDSLDRLPRTLRAVYEDMLKEHARRSGVTAEQQAKILMCVTHASRPLRLIELGSLLSRMLHVDLRRGKDLVRAGCGRLLELLEDETVSVIHHSFTEFLHDVSRKDDEDAFPVLEDEASHVMLAVLSLEYLNGCPHFDATIDDGRTANYEALGFSQRERKRRDKIGTDTRVSQPLASYAVNNLFFHVNKVPPGTPAATQLLAALDRYLVPGEPAFETWMLMNWSSPLSASFSVFHLIAAAPDGALVPVYVTEHFAERQPALLDSRDSDGLTPLAYAAQHGHGDLAEALLAKGADPTSGGNDGLTPLHRAAGQRHAAVVRPLLNAGVDPLIKTWPVLSSYNRCEDWDEEYTEEEAEERRETALSYAFRGDDAEVVKAFMPFVRPDEINQCFHRVDSIENVKAMLETGMADVDCFRSGATKLYKAARDRNLDVIKLLLKHGADPNRRCHTERSRAYNDDIAMEIGQPDCDRGPTPLHAFAGVGYERKILFSSDKETAAECLRVLIEAGADVNATMDGEQHMGQNTTPLHFAVQETSSVGLYWGSMDRSEEILTKLLLSAGANPNAKTKNGNTPLHLANTKKLRLLELLVKHGADINAVNAWGRSPLLEMITRLGYSSSMSLDKPEPNVKVFLKLLELGTDVHLADGQGDTVFHHLMHRIGSFADPKFIPFMEKLLRAGADPNKRNKKSQLPLWRYNQGTSGFSVNDDGDEEVLKMLVDAGMDLNARDEEGRTFLWEFGKRYGVQVGAIEKLVRLGADPGTLTHDGRTLLHSAVEDSKPPEWFRSLISAGARPDALDKDGNTIIHAVLRGPHTTNSEVREVLQVLVEAGALPLAKNAEGQSALHRAGDLDKLEIVLDTPAFRGLDINEPDVDGFTPLHYAVTLGEQAVGKLVSAGVDPTALAATSGLSPLHVAARDGEAGVVGLLLAQYRELNALEKHVNLLGGGRAPLHHACQSGSPEAVWTLLRNGANARMTDEKGLTPLHALAEFEAPKTWPEMFTKRWTCAGDIVGMLQLAGGDLNAEAVTQMEDGTTSRTLAPLDMALERECWEMVRRLVAHGAEPRDGHKQSGDFVLATDKEKAAEEARKAQASVPLGQDSSGPHRGRGRRWRGRWAACPGAKMPPEEGTRFITGGQDILDAKTQNRHGDSNGTDILHSVLRDGDYDTIKEYAQLGGDMLELDVNRDHTFLHHLVEEGHADLLEYFSGKVAELEAQGWVQEDEESCGTLLGRACERELPSLHLVQLLVDKLGVDVNAVYNRRGYCYKLRGATALLHVEALEYLLSKGADIEARNQGGMTPLLAAIDKEYLDGFWREETVRVLLRHGADVNATVKTAGAVSRRSSALEISSQPGITKLLLENEASVESCPGILTRAVREWMEPGIVKLLLDAGLDPNELQGKQKEENETNEEDLRYALHEATRPTDSHYPAFDFKPRQQAVIDLLVSHGADAYAPYPDGSFVLQAIVEDRGQVHSLLPGLSQTNCNRKGHHGRTLLASACIPVVPAGSYTHTQNLPTVMVDVVHALLNSGADPLAVDDDEGRTPLHWLCTFPGQFDEAHRKAFVALARHGPAAVQTTDKQGRKPLHLALATYASRSQHSPFAIQHLLSMGADPADPDPVTGNTALHFIAPRLVGEAAAAATATALFRELAAPAAAGRVDINARNTAGETCVFSFAAAGWDGTRDPTHKESHPTYALAHDTTHAQALDDVFANDNDNDLGGCAADLTAVDGRGRTLLHVTAGREMSDDSSDRDQIQDVEGAFERLMELGVDPRVEDDELRTAVDVAVARDLSGIVRLFSEEGKTKRMEGGREEGEAGRGGYGWSEWE
ncbi:ankyrin repeat-containing domain protein [Chaetomidium leptoderma]|uniref:Ankyrin repeat-containing domain protein n=1 Tax=Chaetomidium leptoderma TaxID=669021 RepID=A0AAN6VV13_9PEZI|nr:ankyrin repeat-containing domain protein [Chaetomidium leptoderma]